MEFKLTFALEVADRKIDKELLKKSATYNQGNTAIIFNNQPGRIDCIALNFQGLHLKNLLLNVVLVQCTWRNLHKIM